MPEFGLRSLRELSTCDERLQRVMNEVVKHIDCTIIEGHRGQEAQHQAFIDKKSKVDYPLSKHNSIPSKAIDIMPYPISWTDAKRIYYFAGFVMAIAVSMGIKLKWGGDWDGDKDLSDQDFNDLPHFEIME